MRLSEIQQSFTRDLAVLFRYIHDKGYQFTLGESFRTAEQAEIYAKSGKGIKNSLHCKRLAIDLNLFNDKNEFLTETKDHEQFGIFWESLHPANRWGGRFTKPDGNHYERNESVSL